MMARDNQEHPPREIHNVGVAISVVLGQATMRLEQTLRLGRGAVIQFEQKTSDPVEVFANGVLIARGEIVITAGEKIGVALSEMVKSIYNNTGG
jgi:flagellar motor switch protein FliN/FliY